MLKANIYKIPRAGKTKINEWFVNFKIRNFDSDIKQLSSPGPKFSLP